MPTLLWLSRHDVNAVELDPTECIDLVRKTMEWQGEGLLEVPAKLGIHPPHGRHINAMPAFVRPLQAAGLKWVADFPENKKFGLATIHGLIVLNNPETGVPLCVMEGGMVTAMRTSAMTAVSLQACALPSAKLGTIVGTGTEALSHVITLPKALPTLRTLRIVGRELRAATRFCEEVGHKAGVELIPFAERELAVRGADIIVTVTNSVSTRLLELDWVSPGATVVVLDNGAKETTLLHSLDRVIVDDRRPFATEEVKRRFPTGVPKIDGEVGEILAGRIQGRRNPQERILILNLGSAACDVVVATEIYQRATKTGHGMVLEL
jgi:ornithine cyclodeaminase/alanine dehydrogenase-like protein (mu-crystallin family)